MWLQKSQYYPWLGKEAYCSQIRLRYFSSQKTCLFWPCKISPVGSNLKISNACWLPVCCPWDGQCQLETRVGKCFSELLGNELALLVACLTSIRDRNGNNAQRKDRRIFCAMLTRCFGQYPRYQGDGLFLIERVL